MELPRVFRINPVKILAKRGYKAWSLVHLHFRRVLVKWISRKEPVPVLVYQMGKVGSTSVFNALKTKDVPVFQVHTLNEKSLAAIIERCRARGHIPVYLHDSQWVRENLLTEDQPLRIITAVRDPIARNISAYFENLHFWRERKSAFDEDELNAMMSEFMNKYSHQVPLSWFDREMRDVLGINVYKYPFPKSKGVQRIQENKIDVLLLKTEVPDDIKVSALREFLQIPELSLEAKNVGKEKAYKHYYQAFLNRIHLPETYLNKMYESRYAQHFYSREEISGFRDRWMRDRESRSEKAAIPEHVS